jgi:two-component system cell cycle sensor histidine kinase/response regulator CckA
MAVRSSKILTVLIVEDNPGDARLIREMLAETQMENSLLPLIVTECQTTLGSALAVLAQKEYSVVLLDLILPDSTGLDTFRKVHTGHSRVPLIIMTAADDEQAAVEAVREGAQDYLVKGRIAANELIMSIRNAVRQKRLEEENKTIHAHLFQAQKMEAVGILAGGVAHDFNNLITAIRGSADMALFKCDAAHPAFRDLKNIQASTERAGQLTRQLLLLCEKRQKEFILFNVNEAVESLFKMLRRILGEDVAVQTRLAADLSLIRADRGSIEQALLNLAVRAREGMQAGGSLLIRTENASIDEAACGRMKHARVGRFVKITVSDTGRPLNLETMAHLFDGFYGGKGDAVRGTGLGLSVVQGIVKEHDGWIEAASQGGSGSVIDIYLPVALEKMPPSSVKKVPFEMLKGKGEKILVVEDEEGIREFVRRSLNEMGYVVSTASTAFEGQTIFRAENRSFNLALIDVVLPDRSGIELAGDLLQQNPMIKVLLCSGYMDHKSQWPLIEEKGYMFMQKPYTLAELLKKLRDVLG